MPDSKPRTWLAAFLRGQTGLIPRCRSTRPRISENGAAAMAAPEFHQADTSSDKAKSQVRRLPLYPQFLHRGAEAQYLPSASFLPCCSTRHGVPVIVGLLHQTGYLHL